jgi:hypothetical protein
VPRARSGPVTAVPCPWCGKKNNLTSLPENIGQQTYKNTAFRIDCDHCDAGFVITRVVTTITVAQYREDNNG